MNVNNIYNEDCLETMSSIEDSTVDLIVTSPPYNKNLRSKKLTNSEQRTSASSFRSIDYDEYGDDMPHQDYVDWQKKIIEECLRILKPTGSLFYNHKDILHKHNTLHPTYLWDYPVKQLLIWDRKNTPSLDPAYFYPTTEWVFWIKKNVDSKPKFNRKNSLFSKSVITLSPDSKNVHPAPFPIELPNNFILSCTDVGDVVYDPFMGSGTTALAAIINDRKFIGSEISEKYYNDSLSKIEIMQSQQRLF
tara:strand:- start:252 stop:995 length:744 start_codon:yes stop_codon:yes gene_type:complete